MKRMKNIWRLIQINYTLARYRIDNIVLQHHYFYSLRFLSYLNPWNWRRRTLHSRGESIRLALEALGPVFIKFGQMLSTRRDLLPADIADELAKLQDAVPPFSGTLAKQMLEEIYEQPLSTLFKQVDLQPLASASIAQVHAAELFDGKQVVIKILRPQVEQQIKQDVAVMYFLAKIVDSYWKRAKRLKARELVAEFEESILGELDLQREAANASQLRRHFLGSPELYIPEVYWNYTRRRAMVMERIHGIPVRDLAQLRERGVNLKKLAERGLEIFFTQVFRDSFFHADMHPGNIFVSYQNPHDPHYIAVDFGIMGSLNPVDQRYIAENFLAFFKRDYRRVAILHVESGWAPPHTRIDQLEMAIRAVCEPIFERPLAEISFGQLLLGLFQMAARFEIEIQPQLVLLQKTLLNIEGLGRHLYPQLDLWKTAKPFLERWIRQQVGPRAFLRKVRQYAPLWLEQLPEWPQLVYTTLQRFNTTSSKYNHSCVSVANKPKQRQQGFIFGFISAALISVLSFLFFHMLRH